MSIARHHAEWLALLDISGPFLALPVLARVFPQGLDAPDADVARELRLAYEEWLDNSGGLHADPAIHRTWVEWVLRRVLEMPDEVLRARHALSAGQPWPSVLVAEHGEELRPDFVIAEPGEDGKARVLVVVVPPGQGLEKPMARAAWQASPATRMMTLLRGAKVRLGLLTNGEQWMLVDRPDDENATTGFASWYARLWLEEPLTLRAFRSLLGARRLFGVPDNETLEALLAESAGDQQEVTDQLGYQVRRAVELLVQALDLADQNEGRRLLRDLPEERLYEAALSVMMRLVFLLFAEEQNLLLLGDDIYDRHYAASTLLGALREEADRVGEEVLERRYDAWGRLLAIFRAVYGGFRHDRLTMPAYGGSLFDPDRFPFLEGRPAGSSWLDTPANPPQISNRVVLHLLEALQMLQVKVRDGSPKEARRLSFRALDIEQIGHVYEGLLDHTAVRAREPILGIIGTREQEPEIALATLEQEAQKGEQSFLALLKEQTGRSPSALKKAWAAAPDAWRAAQLRAACGNDEALYARVLPFAGLVRDDDYGRPTVIPAGSVYVTAGAERRATGTHYTPRSLTEPIVEHTLEPLVYHGPAEGLPRDQWKLRPAADLLRLTVCDMAMGSGAFLVQACRYLSERLLEAWRDAEGAEEGQRRLVTPEGFPTLDPDAAIPADPAERLIFARRLVADRCLYGVDKNPLAVEMAKLSLWLITLAKGRPFSFLDHALRCGDSLLGIGNLEQLTRWSLRVDQADSKLDWVTGPVEKALRQAFELRREIRTAPVLDARDAEQKRDKLAKAERAMALVRLGADLLVAAALAPDAKAREERRGRFLTRYAMLLRAADEGRDTASLAAELRREANALLQGRRPFHWPLEFPEVFDPDLGERPIEQLLADATAGTLSAEGTSPGFSAIVGNPPFQYGTLATIELGEEYMYALQRINPPWHGKSDLVVGFFKQAARVLSTSGFMALISTASLIRGETLESGIRDLIRRGFIIYNARSSYKWPGKANLEVVNVAMTRNWQGVFSLDNAIVDGIEEDLTPGKGSIIEPRELERGIPAFLGVKISPNNYKISIGDHNSELYALNPPDSIFVPVIGGDELYALINPSDAPRAVDPDKLNFWVKTLDLPTRKKEELIKAFHHAAPATALTQALKEATFAFACGETSTILKFVRVPTTGAILKHKLIVFPANNWSTFAVLQSDIHVSWAWRWGLRRNSNLVYSPKRCANTFPLPEEEHITTGNNKLEQLGSFYHQYRHQVILARQEGLTKTYNRFHDPREHAADIAELRRLHVEMDNAVAAAYGWTDLELGHGFHETKQGLRYTISEAARREVLDRLLRLNHERYAEEVAAGLHDKGAKKAAKGAGSAKKTTKAPAKAENAATPQLRIDFGEAPAATPAPTGNGDDRAYIQLKALLAQRGSLSNGEVQAALGVDSDTARKLLQRLVDEKVAAVVGQKRGTRYVWRR